MDEDIPDDPNPSFTLGGLPLGRVPSDVLGWLEATASAEAAMAAARYELVDAVRRDWIANRGLAEDASGMVARSLRAEVAAALSVPERTAENLLGVADVLITSLPLAFAAFQQGRFSERNARILVDTAAGLEAEQMVQFERRALPWAEALTPPKFERKARTLRELIAPSDATERHREAVTARDVGLAPGRDGMGTLEAHGPAAKVVAVHNRIDTIARSLKVPGEERTLAQLRADVFFDLLLDEGALLPPAKGERALREKTRHRGILPTVHLTVPALTAMGRGNEPGILEGYGPIDADTARRLAGAASGFYRILTDPHTGVALSLGRKQYPVPPALRRYLRARDGTCRFPGCNLPARICDIDPPSPQACGVGPPRDWATGGPTDDCNLAHLCEGHHRLKHATGWMVHQAPDGSATMTWTSPEGRTYTTQPEMRFNGGGIAQTEWALDDTAPPF